MRNVSTVARLVLGGYLAAHGAQKLFGMFGGHGLEGTAKGFERLGLTPGREMAMLAGAAQLAATGGFELPLTNLALAGVLLAAGHRGRHVSGSLPKPVTGLVLVLAA